MVLSLISSQSEGLGKMTLGIVKIYLGSPFSANRCCPRSVCSLSVGLRSVVVDPAFLESRQNEVGSIAMTNLFFKCFD